MLCLMLFYLLNEAPIFPNTGPLASDMLKDTAQPSKYCMYISGLLRAVHRVLFLSHH